MHVIFEGDIWEVQIGRHGNTEDAAVDLAIMQMLALLTIR
jgi:hypothetical protein